MLEKINIKQYKYTTQQLKELLKQLILMSIQRLFNKLLNVKDVLRSEDAYLEPQTADMIDLLLSTLSGNSLLVKKTYYVLLFTTNENCTLLQ